MNQLFLPDFGDPGTAARVAPPSALRDGAKQTDIRVAHATVDEAELDEFHDAIDDENLTPMQIAIAQGNHRPKKRKKSNKPKARDRCRRCGKEWSLPEWIQMHQIPVVHDDSQRKQNRNLRHQPGRMAHDYCTVPASSFEEGFQDGRYLNDLEKAMPRRTNKSRKSA